VVESTIRIPVTTRIPVTHVADLETRHRVILGDSRCMRELSDDSVQFVVTSPPYWNIKDYGHASQIGYHDTYDDYIASLNQVWAECYRVLCNGCRMCINVGDQFAGVADYGRYKIIPIRASIIRFCEKLGFDYMGAVIWRKPTTCNPRGGSQGVMGSYLYPRNGVVKIDYEFILIFKKLGKPAKISKAIKEASKMTKEEWNAYFIGHWSISGVRQDRHPAMFPLEIPLRLIKMFSFVGETVLDPFLGSGTTSRAAKVLHRESVGYEINRGYVPLILEKIDRAFC